MMGMRVVFVLAMFTVLVQAARQMSLQQDPAKHSLLSHSSHRKVSILQVGAPARQRKEPVAEFTAETMPKVSPAVQCVINLSIQYFVVYTLLAFMRTFNQFTGNSMLGMQKILETACTTVTYAPMLAVLFLGIRMRAIQLTQGQTEKYGLPQWWVQHAMYVCS
jgi:hypothetical protein